MKQVKILKKKACRWCGMSFQPNTSLQVVCGYKCAIDLAKEKMQKHIRVNEKRAQRDWNKRKKDLREKLKTLSEYEKEARKFFQMWVRLRDKDLPCISCEAVTAGQWDGGHYFKAELYSGLIFNEDNCSKQCSRCNNELHGNEANYRIGLVKKIGEERVKWLEDNKDRLRTVKYSKEELIEIKKYYQQKIKTLKQL